MWLQKSLKIGLKEEVFLKCLFLFSGSDACTGHGGLQFDCNLCNKTFRTYRQLNAHNLSHFEKKRYGEGGMAKCKVCGQVVPDSTGLTEHMLQHAGSNSHVSIFLFVGFFLL